MMNAPRLILKQPTGWFAAGREVTQAMRSLSDAAFKLYLYLCLHAERHTGRLILNLAEATKELGKDPAWIEDGLDKLCRQPSVRALRRSDRNLRPVLAISEAARHGGRGAGSGVRPAGAHGLSETGMCTVHIHRGG